MLADATTGASTFTLTANVVVVELLAASFAVTEKVNVPPVVGVPVSLRVIGSKLNPGGRFAAV
ncbi:hypothetical protein D3C71_1670160 [compost metagenome]